MESGFDINKISFQRALLSHVQCLLNIVHRCVKEVNCKDYEAQDVERFLKGFNNEWLERGIRNKHFYVVKYNEEIIGMGAVARDLAQESQSYFTTIFINPDYHKMGIGRRLIKFLEEDEWCLDSNLIEIPSSKSSHEFYYKLGYEYRAFPPVFGEDGSTIMYKQKGDFQFRNFDLLTDGEIDLKIIRKAPSNKGKGYVPAYKYKITLHGCDDKIGVIDIRIGNNENTYYGGNIGYEINEFYRGNHYAAKACKIIKQVAVAHNMDKIIITCNPDNFPSRKTCENAGLILKKIVDIPSHTEMYKLGRRKACVYECNLRQGDM